MALDLKKYRVLAVAISMSLPTRSVLAIESKARIGGLYEFRTMYYKSSGRPKQRMVSRRNNEFGMNSFGSVFLDYRLIGENNNLYGARIGFEHTSAKGRSASSYLYTEFWLGRIEAGSEASAGSKMRITGYNSAGAPGGGWSSAAVISARGRLNPAEKLAAYINNFGGFLDSKYSRKISYYTPRIPLAAGHNLQIGVSYIPDSSNTGHERIDLGRKKSRHVSAPYKFVIKDGISYGAVYRGYFSRNLSGKIAFTGEAGSLVAFSKVDSSKIDTGYRKLNAYVISAGLKYDRISLSVAYSDYNRSLTPHKTSLAGRSAIAHSYSIGYEVGKCAFSFSQFRSSHMGSKLDSIALGASYIMAKGLKLYAQATLYKTRGKYLRGNVAKIDQSKGGLIYLGAKVSL